MPETRELWAEFLHPANLCGLCGNTGWIDTRGKVFSPAGVECGVRRPCICPDGRAVARNPKQVGDEERKLDNLAW